MISRTGSITRLWLLFILNYISVSVEKKKILNNSCNKIFLKNCAEAFQEEAS